MIRTMHSYRNYVFSISYDPPGFVIDFPDIPNIITSAPTLDEAFHNACEALDLYLETSLKFGDPIPEPRHQLLLREVEH